MKKIFKIEIELLKEIPDLNEILTQHLHYLLHPKSIKEITIEEVT